MLLPKTGTKSLTASRVHSDFFIRALLFRIQNIHHTVLACIVSIILKVLDHEYL